MRLFAAAGARCAYLLPRRYADALIVMRRRPAYARDTLHDFHATTMITPMADVSPLRRHAMIFATLLFAAMSCRATLLEQRAPEARYREVCYAQALQRRREIHMRSADAAAARASVERMQRQHDTRARAQRRVASAHASGMQCAAERFT